MGISTAVGVDGAAGLAPGREALAILGLTLLSEVVALLSLGLVRPWGEVFPSWMPLIGGRRVPPVGASVLAATGAVALMAIWTFATVNFFVLTVFGAPGNGFVFVNGGWEARRLLPTPAALGTAAGRPHVGVLPPPVPGLARRRQAACTRGSAGATWPRSG